MAKYQASANVDQTVCRRCGAASSGSGHRRQDLPSGCCSASVCLGFGESCSMPLPRASVMAPVYVRLLAVASLHVLQMGPQIPARRVNSSSRPNCSFILLFSNSCEQSACWCQNSDSFRCPADLYTARRLADQAFPKPMPRSLGFSSPEVQLRVGDYSQNKFNLTCPPASTFIQPLCAEGTS